MPLNPCFPRPLLSPFLRPILACAAAVLLALTARPEPAQAQAGPPAGQPRPVQAFEAVRVKGGPVEVVLRQGREARLWVQARDEDAALVETRVSREDGRETLVIDFRPPAGRLSRSVPRVQVDWTRLSAVSLQGSADLLVDGAALPALSVQVQGSGGVRLKGVDTPALSLALAGSGDIVAEGRARSLAVSLAGSGDVKAVGLEADVVEVSIAGSGEVEVHARQTLSAQVAGSGDLRHRGPARVQSRVTGSGKVSSF